jgi:hypothetical protein
MPKRSGNPQDLNQIAAKVVAQSTKEPLPVVQSKAEKNPAAVALVHLGGLKGGKARAEKLSAKRRSEIARKAATTRWERP